MKKIILKLILLITFTIPIFSHQEVFVYSKNKFSINGNKNFSMYGKKYIVLDLNNGLGRFFAFNANGSLYLYGRITGGTPDTRDRTPEGIFSVIQKQKYHMSTLYPADDGNNNMNDMLKITNSGVALHKGSLNYYSHGCIHIDPKKSRQLFNWADYNTKVVITNDFFVDTLRK